MKHCRSFSNLASLNSQALLPYRSESYFLVIPDEMTLLSVHNVAAAGHVKLFLWKNAVGSNKMTTINVSNCMKKRLSCKKGRKSGVHYSGTDHGSQS
jgi:hypothetical protein